MNDCCSPLLSTRARHLIVGRHDDGLVRPCPRSNESVLSLRAKEVDRVPNLMRPREERTHGLVDILIQNEEQSRSPNAHADLVA